MKEVLRKVLGYFGRRQDKRQGPTVLGMETHSHRYIPDAEDIRRAVREAKEVLNKKKE